MDINGFRCQFPLNINDHKFQAHGVFFPFLKVVPTVRNWFTNPMNYRCIYHEYTLVSLVKPTNLGIPTWGTILDSRACIVGACLILSLANPLEISI